MGPCICALYIPMDGRDNTSEFKVRFVRVLYL